MKLFSWLHHAIEYYLEHTVFFVELFTIHMWHSNKRGLALYWLVHLFSLKLLQPIYYIHSQAALLGTPLLPCWVIRLQSASNVAAPKHKKHTDSREEHYNSLKSL